jgi:hypothetical protein
MVIFRKTIFFCLVAAWLVALAACSSPPKNPHNLCSIFEENDDWFDDAVASEKKWGASIPVMMAIMYHESAYRDNAKPGYRWFMGFIPLGRQSSAYGYAQALDGTWKRYINETDNSGADRDDFDDAIDFIGWYTRKSQKLLGLKMTDAYSQYLAYHEGQAGFRKGTYRKKAWLVKVARRVAKRAVRYQSQLKGCRADLE